MAEEYWTRTATELLVELGTSDKGLTSNQVEKRLAQFGPNRLKKQSRTGDFTLLISQFKSPIILILIVAALLSAFLRDASDAILILAIVLVSGLLGFWQERGATRAVDKLLAIVQVKAKVCRDDQPVEIPLDQIVPGDVVELSAGDLVPGDCVILTGKDLHADEATLTGETFPAEKSPGVLSLKAPLSQRTNSLFLGTSIVSGTARVVVVRTGLQTEFGKVSGRLRFRPSETEFERGVRRFGYLLAEVTLIILTVIFAFNVYFHRPVLDSFLFALALAVGLTPQLLPVIITVNLSHGARQMAAHKAILKRMAAIENLGSMNVLCSDKTGTLTEGKVRLQSALSATGSSSENVLAYAYLNAFHQTGFANPIDRAILEHGSGSSVDVAHYRKVDEIPYDFLRKRLTVVLQNDQKRVLVTKGALQKVLEVCTQAQADDGSLIALASLRPQIDQTYRELSNQGFRTLGVAYRTIDDQSSFSRDSETEMVFLGFVVLCDQLKPDACQSIARLRQLGIRLKVISGDNRLVAAHVCGELGLEGKAVLTGPEIREMSDGALVQRVNDVDVFAEVEPNQKERLVRALTKGGHVVGYLGDGINDASAMHAADVSISVEGAVDVAKEVADLVLLERDLGILAEAVREGRRTFANTLKYVFMATSANFGNMFSMAGASLLLPFLPMLPKQILIMNLLTDVPEMTIASDEVDEEMTQRPERWDIAFIRRFMIWFGLLSSAFDFLTFGVLWWLDVTPEQFRTSWFVESILSASLIVLVVRTRQPFFRSKPAKPLLVATLAVVAATLIMPMTPVARLFGFELPPPAYLPMLLLIVTAYILSAELLKHVFYAQHRELNGVKRATLGETG